MDPPATSYLDRDGAALAYQVVGTGPVDVVWYLEISQHLDLCWTDPHIHNNFEHGTTYSRTVYMQARGFGLSDPVNYAPTIEQQADDLLAVMDAVGMRRATLVGIFGNCGAPALVAARAPNRVAGLVLVNPYAQGVHITTDELHGWTDAEAEEFVAGYRSAIEHWGSGEIIKMWDPAQDTAFNRRLMALLERCSATPMTAAGYLDWLLKLDVSDVLRSVQVPTRVLGIPNNPVPDAAVAYVADLVPGATLHMLPVAKPGSSMGEAWVPIFDHVEEAATGAHRLVDADRFLGTVLFTDVVASTEKLGELGDAGYRELRASHERQVRLDVERHGGRLVDVVGDGTLSVFDGPTKAVRCGQAICADAAELGIAVRAGVHTGELERSGPAVSGMTVHIGARVGAAAGAGEVVVSRTVHDLVVGSGLKFVSRGEQTLKGIPGNWELYALTDAAAQTGTVSAEAPEPTGLDRAYLETARRSPRAARAAIRIGNAWQRRIHST
jgi:class 3 adenylate cyclase/pimeloyl-ACP methyl ester carboxylesterase